jgi:hypothetical protein
MEQLWAEFVAAGRSPQGFEVIVPAPDLTDPEQLAPLLELGISAITVQPWPRSPAEPTSVEEKLELLEQFAARLLVALHALRPSVRASWPPPMSR